MSRSKEGQRLTNDFNITYNFYSFEEWAAIKKYFRLLLTMVQSKNSIRTENRTTNLVAHKFVLFFRLGACTII